MDAVERALLEAVAADLAADAPRVVYADWLLSQGRGWGEFIHMSIADPKGKATAKLLRAHAKDGLGAAYPFVERKPFAFDRGIPARLTASGAPLAKCIDEVMLRAPGATAVIGDVLERHLDALAPARAFRGGELWARGLKDRGLQKLCVGDLLTPFRVLQLREPKFGAAGIAALASCASAAALEELFVIGDRCDLAPVLASTTLTRLTEITADTTSLTEALRTCRRSLVSLYVSGLDDFNEEDARLLAASPTGPVLSTLSLGRVLGAGPSWLIPQRVIDLCASLPGLRDLWLTSFGISSEAADAIAAARGIRVNVR